jgi:NhaP-type Na+/H+ or K+/H+ antiporter
MTKFLSVLAGLGLIDLSLQTLDSDNNILFLFFSSNKAVALIRLALGAFIIFIAFKGAIKYRLTYYISAAIAALLIVFPLVGMIIPQITYSIYGVVKPMDYLVSLAFGVILSACVLETQQLNQSFSWRSRLPQIYTAELFNSLLHAPSSGHRHTKRARA